MITINDTASVLAEYTNGDYQCALYTDGTYTRTALTDSPKPAHPSSIDIKITNFCNMGCAYCHESSTTAGVHGDLNYLLTALSDLPAGVELALGGGNPLSHPGLLDFLTALKVKGLIANLTVNQGHLRQYRTLLQALIADKLVYGLGVSLTNVADLAPIKDLMARTPHVVIHVIAGVVSPFGLLSALKSLPYIKLLVLGYKTFGFGVAYGQAPEVGKCLVQWAQQIHTFIGRCVLCFDNLAIEQLDVYRFFTDAELGQYYMGDDFTHSMYIDAVEQQYAPTSRSAERVSMDTINLLEFFNHARR